MRNSQLLNEYYERQKNKQVSVKINHVEAVVAQMLEQNPQWNFHSLHELERSIGLPRSPHCPLVRWTSRKPHGPQNSVWCFPELFPALPEMVAYSRGSGPGTPIPFKTWAAELGLISDVEIRFRKALFYWPHSEREDLGWVNRAISNEFSISLLCDIDPFQPYASLAEFQSCL